MVVKRKMTSAFLIPLASVAHYLWKKRILFNKNACRSHVGEGSLLPAGQKVLAVQEQIAVDTVFGKGREAETMNAAGPFGGREQQSLW